MHAAVVEPAVVLASAGAVAWALRARVPRTAAESAALAALALCAAVLDRRCAVCNARFGFRKASRTGLSLGLMTVPCTLVAVLLSAQHAPGADLPLVRCFLHAALGCSTMLALSAWLRALDAPARPLQLGNRAMLVTLGSQLLFPETPAVLVLCATLAVEPTLRLLLARLPSCFTLGEAAALAQAGTLLAVDGALIIGCGSSAAGRADRPLCVSRDRVLAVAEVGLCCAVLLGPWLAAARAAAAAVLGRPLPPSRRAPVVFAAMGTFFALVLYPALCAVLHPEGPLAWLLRLLGERPVRVAILAYWLVLTIGAIALIGRVRTRMPLIIVRKLYHFLAVLLFIPAMLVEKQLMRIAFAGALSLFLALEYVRMAGADPLARLLVEFLARYTDARDAGPLITTHIYLLLGCALPVLFTPSSAPWVDSTSSPSAVLPPMAGILALGVGDSMASYVGTRFGRTRWPGTAKTAEGTAAAVAAILVGACVLCRASAALAPAEPVSALSAGVIARILAATVSTCVLEAVTEQIDNLFLPLHFFCMLRVALGLAQGGGCSHAPPPLHPAQDGMTARARFQAATRAHGLAARHIVAPKLVVPSTGSVADAATGVTVALAAAAPADAPADAPAVEMPNLRFLCFVNGGASAQVMFNALKASLPAGQLNLGHATRQ
ncbi:hypothetical protein T492DRAFT_857737 [Pavlovales sp. CCMP2436]|nr:hypothetical protein T492DRAFT_857737 [Pavlovales sp. CCMP2436]